MNHSFSERFGAQTPLSSNTPAPDRTPQLAGLTDADDRQLAALGLWLADDLERRLETHSGIIRRLARRLVELSPRDKPPGGCPVCGQDVPENTRGRPRTYCSTRCKNAARSKVSEMSNWE